MVAFTCFSHQSKWCDSFDWTLQHNAAKLRRVDLNDEFFYIHEQIQGKWRVGSITEVDQLFSSVIWNDKNSCVPQKYKYGKESENRPCLIKTHKFKPVA